MDANVSRYTTANVLYIVLDSVLYIYVSVCCFQTSIQSVNAATETSISHRTLDWAAVEHVDAEHIGGWR